MIKLNGTQLECEGDILEHSSCARCNRVNARINQEVVRILDNLITVAGSKIWNHYASESTGNAIIKEIIKLKEEHTND